MGSWLGYGTLPRPVVGPSARAAIATALAGVDGQRVGTLSPEPLATALVFENRCASCRTFFGMVRVHVPLIGPFSATVDTLCIRSNCKHLTVTHASPAGIHASVSGYEGGPHLNGYANGHRRR